MVEVEVRCFARQVVAPNSLSGVNRPEAVVLFWSRNMRLIPSKSLMDVHIMSSMDGTGLVNISSRLQMPYPACINAEKIVLIPQGSAMTGSSCLPARDAIACLCRLRLLLAPRPLTILSHLCDMGYMMSLVVHNATSRTQQLLRVTSLLV